MTPNWNGSGRSPGTALAIRLRFELEPDETESTDRNGDTTTDRKGAGMKILVTLGIAAALSLAAVAAAAQGAVSAKVASAAVKGCPGGGPLIVNAFATFRNLADFGADGHVWALDAGRASMQIWQVETNTYCVKRPYVGMFTTFAGMSPEGTGTVGDGVTGRWRGEIVALIHGTFAPKVVTSGFVGDFDGQCQQDGTCLGTVFNPRLYFSTIESFEFLAFGATFEAGPCGVWRQSLSGDTGDIVC